jgi:RNA polymerase sigma factor (sigma-70 family)
VTRLVANLRSSDRAVRDEAAREIWERFSQQLLELARRHISRRLASRTSPEDILQSMYMSLCHRVQRDQFAVNDRDDLWKLLITMTLNKTRMAARHHLRLRRDPRREQSSAAPGGMEPDRDGLLEDLGARGPDAQEAAILTETIDEMLTALPPELRQIALWKLDGLTNEQIAASDRLDCAVRTVERKLAGIREIWSRRDERE